MGLKIKEVEADDTGTYICKATNGFGSVNINYTLIVIGECRWPCCVYHIKDFVSPVAPQVPEMRSSRVVKDVTVVKNSSSIQHL